MSRCGMDSWGSTLPPLTLFFIGNGGQGLSPDPDLRSLITLAGDIELNPGPTDRCTVCNGVIRRGTNPLTCAKGCGKSCHIKEQCSGIKYRCIRDTQWVCSQNCSGSPTPTAPPFPLAQVTSGATPPPNRGEDTPIASPGSQLRDPLAATPRASLVSQSVSTGLGKCLACRNRLRRQALPLFCSSCQSGIHLSCSGLARKEFDRWAESGRWVCALCSSSPVPAPPVPPLPQPVKAKRGSFVDRQGLRIMQWNADGIGTALPSLTQLMLERAVDLCLVQETKLGPKDTTPRVPGYVSVRRDRPNPRTDRSFGGGLLIFIKQDIPYSEASVFREGSVPGPLEALAVRVRLSHRDWLTVVNVYSPPFRPQGQSQDQGFSSLISSRNHFFGGDWNAHSRMWDRFQPEDGSGVALEQWMSGEGLCALNDGAATRVNKATGGLSTPDVSLMHSVWLGRVDWCCLDPLDSDHFPILCDIGLGVQFMQEEAPKLRWNWNSADWSGYRSAVELAVQQFRVRETPPGLSDMVALLTEAMLDAARVHVKMVRITSRPLPWMTPELAGAIRLRNTLGRDLSLNRDAWIDACQQVRTMVADIKAQRWRSFVESLQDHSDSSRAWNVLRSLSGKAPSQADRSKALVHDGREYVTDREKADLFVRKYAQISSHRFTKEERVSNRRVRIAMAREGRKLGPFGPECADFSSSELAAAIREMKPRGAEGLDEIPPRFLQELGAEARSFMLMCFNKSWQQGLCPQSWRTAVIVPLLKKDKPAGEIDSYRPISLTSCLGKLMERMVANRLYHLAESRGLLVEDQAGFRAQRSTEDQILRVTQTISDGFQAKPALRSVMALLDFSKAYDTVWRTDLMSSLMKAGIPFPYLRWIRGFLTNRQGCVRLNGTMSSFKLFREGLPQGSVLSPLLFLFVINDLRPRLKSDVTSMFADDVGLIAQHRNLAVAAATIEADVVEVHRWSQEKKLHLNIAKCEVSFFSPDPKESTPEWLPPIYVDSTPLKFNPTPVFLGVTYDRTLSFRPQAERVAGKVTATSRLLTALSGREWGWDANLLRRVYQSIGLSAMRYCGPGWQPWLSRSNVEVLERAQQKCLRAITGMYSTTPVEALRLEGGFPAIAAVIKRDAALAMEKSLRLSPTNPRFTLAAREVRHRTNRGSWRKLAAEVLRSTDLAGEPRAALPPPTAAPWQWGSQAWLVNLNLMGDRLVESRQVNALATIFSYGPLDLTIFTDGSAAGGTSDGGYAAVICRGSLASLEVIDCVGGRGAKLTSSFDAEVSALMAAVEWLCGNVVGRGKYLICSDSRAALTTLQSGAVGSSSDVARLRMRLQDVPGVVCFQWVPGHCGLEGNELADQAANEARRLPGPRAPISYSSAKAYIRRAVRDAPPSHQRTLEIYGDRRPPFPSATLGSNPRRLSTLLAQLRGGHSCVLAAYRHRVDAAPSPTCPKCGEAPEDLEHWLQSCPATLGIRARIFGRVDPPLSVLTTDVDVVASYLRGLRLL